MIKFLVASATQSLAALSFAVMSFAALAFAALAWTLISCGLPTCHAQEHRPTPHVTLVDGATFSGQLASTTSNKSVLFKTEQRARDVVSDELVSWGQQTLMPLRPLVILRDRSVLVLASEADVMEFTAESLTFDSEIWGEIEIPRDVVAAVVLESPSSRKKRDQLVHQILAGQPNVDRVITKRNDSIQGQLIGVDANTVQLVFDERRVAIPRTSVASIVLKNESAPATASMGAATPGENAITGVDKTRNDANPISIEAAKTLSANWGVGLRDGSYILAKEFTLLDDRLRLTLTNGTMIESQNDHDAVPEWVSSLRTFGRRVVYLSDLKPTGYRHVSYLSISWPYAMNQNLFGETLVAAKIPFAKGIAMHSTSRLTFALPTEAERFQSELAIDDSADGAGSVKFRIFLEREGNWNPVFESKRIIGNQHPQACNVDIVGATSISLVVDYSDRANERDYADWLNARLILKR